MNAWCGCCSHGGVWHEKIGARVSEKCTSSFQQRVLTKTVFYMSLQSLFAKLQTQFISITFGDHNFCFVYKYLLMPANHFSSNSYGGWNIQYLSGMDAMGRFFFHFLQGKQYWLLPVCFSEQFPFGSTLKEKNLILWGILYSFQSRSSRKSEAKTCWELPPL